MEKCHHCDGTGMRRQTLTLPVRQEGDSVIWREGVTLPEDYAASFAEFLISDTPNSFWRKVSDQLLVEIGSQAVKS